MQYLVKAQNWRLLCILFVRGYALPTHSNWKVLTPVIAKQEKPVSLELVDQGRLSRPGPIGRLVRLLLGILCLYALWELITIAPYFIERPIELLPNLVLMVFVVLCVFNYVVNIGFSKDWKSYPLFLSLSVFVIVGSIGFLITGSAESRALGVLIVLWMGYFYVHLGTSFVLAAIIATPGCEMRAIPELLGKITKKGVKEHHCPSSIISGIDRWENDRRMKQAH